jgi:GDP-mannose transporter
MIYTATKSLQRLSVAMFTVFKNLTIVVLAICEKHLFKTNLSSLKILAILLIVASSIVGGFNDLQFEARGYLWMGLNCLASATYGLGMRLVIKRVSFEDFDSVYFNNLLATPIILILSLCLDDWGQVANYLGNGKLVLGILLSSLFAFFIGFSTAWCMRVATSTSYGMVGALNKLPVAFSGMMFFPEERKNANIGSIMSIFLAFSSGLVYSLAQLRERPAVKYEKIAPESTVTIQIK